MKFWHANRSFITTTSFDLMGFPFSMRKTAVLVTLFGTCFIPTKSSTERVGVQYYSHMTPN